MTRDVLAVAPDTALSAVSRLLELHRISGVPVVDERGHPIGLVSKSDLVLGRGPRTPGGSHTYYRLWNGEARTMGSVADGGMSTPGVAADVMSAKLRAIDAHADLHEAARRLITEGVHRLLVVENGRLIGLLAAADCLRGLTRARGTTRP